MKRFLTFFIVLVSGISDVSAKLTGDDFPFVRFDCSNSSISYDGISCIFQDSRGMMWIGSFNGLNRYDGSTFTVYDKKMLGTDSDYIHCIEEDSEGNVWIGTDMGAVVYDYRQDTFRPFLEVSTSGTVIANKVNNIRRYGDRIWLTANRQGLFSYDVSSGVLVNYFVEGTDTVLPQGIRRFVIDSNGNVWMGLYYNDFYKAGEDLQSFSTVDFCKGIFAGDNIQSLVFSRETSNILYLLSVNNGLMQIDIKQGTVRSLLRFPHSVIPLELCLESGRCIWIPTNQGLYRYDLVDGTHFILNEERSNSFSLSDDYVCSVFVDNSGGIWAGTYSGGLNYSGPEQQNFRKYNSCEGLSLERSGVNGFADDGKGNMYVATTAQGLLKLDIESGVLSRYSRRSFYESLRSPCWHDGYLWLGTANGLIRLNVATGAVKRYSSFLNASIGDTNCYVVYSTDSGHLYVGTTLGLMKYDPDTDRFSHLPEFEGVFVKSIDEDSRGRMWIATDADGIFLYDPCGGDGLRNWRYEDGLPDNKFSTVLVDGSDRVWALSFSSGFNLYDKVSDRFIRYDRSNIPNLPTDVFFNAVDDKDGNIWLASDKGLVMFSPESEYVSVYTRETGLLDDILKSGAAKDGKGNMYISSRNGFVRFNPDRFHISRNSPRMLLSDLRVGGVAVCPGPDSPIESNIDIADEIRLASGQNTFGLRASLLSLSTAPDNRILCCLEGFDSRPRIYADNSILSWYNVPAGEYRLIIKGSTVPGKWNVFHHPIKVEVQRHILASPLFICIYVLAVVLAVSIGVLLYTRRIRILERDRMEAFENEVLFQTMTESLPTILLISDETSVRQSIKTCVADECNVIAAMSSRSAGITLETVKVDLVIVDLETRHLDGEEFCSSVRGSETCSRIPLIVLSQDASIRKRTAYMDIGVTIYVEKPFSGEYLLSCVRTLFNREKMVESAISESIISMKIHRMKMDSRDEDFINLLEKAVMDNLSNPDFGSAGLETAMAMSRSSLVRRMKALLDTTPNEYIKQKRLAVAARMLEENNVRVNEICYAVGFKYPSYFTRCFKEVYGHLPADYRKKCSKNTQKCPTSKRPS